MKKCSFLLIIILLFIFFPKGFSQEERPFIITHGPYLQHLTDNEVAIIWTTNKDAVSWVEIAPNDSSHFYMKERPKYFSANHGLKAVGKKHTVKLENLIPSTKYRYRAYSQEVLINKYKNVQYGTVAATDVYKQTPLEFTTGNQANEKITFLIINDIHGDNKRMENLLNMGDHQNSDFVFFNGDMANALGSEEQMFKDFMDTAIELFAKEKPMYFARGNHETRGSFAAEFPTYFPSPTGNLFYLLRRGPVCFVVLDSGEDKPDSDIEYGGIAAFDEYREKQKDWLEEALLDEDFISAPFKVVIAHMPPFGRWHGDVDNGKQFLPLLNKAGVDIMICGHRHRYFKMDPQPGIRFPILVNAHNTVVKSVAEKERLTIKVINMQGGLVDSLQVFPNR